VYIVIFRLQIQGYNYPLCQIKLNFLTDLDHYLKVSKDHNQNTINKVIERLKKVMKIAVGNGWLTSDPFMLYQKKKHVKEVVFLSNLELKKLENHKFAQERLALVRDCFIFSCYTGLAYNEAALLVGHVHVWPRIEVHSLLSLNAPICLISSTPSKTKSNNGGQYAPVQL
jgi:hypothetical protein